MSGKIKKSALYKLRKGEVVVPAYKVKIVNQVLNKSKVKNSTLSSKELSQRKIKPKPKYKRKSQKINRKKHPSTIFNLFR